MLIWGVVPKAHFSIVDFDLPTKNKKGNVSFWGWHYSTLESCFLFFCSGGPVPPGEVVLPPSRGSGLFLGILFMPALLGKESCTRGIRTSSCSGQEIDQT